MKHSSPISGIAVSTNYVATAGYDNRVILWDRLSLEALAVGFHDHLANQCEFSSCGKFLVSSSSDYTARLWKLPEMQLIKVLSGHNDDVEFATFDNKVEKIITASRDKSIIISNIYSDVNKIMTGHDADVLSVQFVNNSLISCSDDGTIRKWNIETGANEILTKSNFQMDTISINNESIFAGDDAGIIYLIEGETITQVKAHNSGIKRLYFFNSEQLLVTMAYDRQCILWKFTDKSLKEITRFDLPNIVWPRSCAVYENLIYFATFGSSFATYDYNTETWKLDHIQHTNGINAMMLYNKKIYTIGDSGVLRVNNEPIYETSSLSNFIIRFKKKILVGGQNGQLLNATDEKCVFQYKSPLNCAVVCANKLCIGTYTGELLIYFNFNDTPQVISLHSNAIKDITIVNKHIITVCANGEICRYDIQQKQKTVVQGHDNIINGCATINDSLFVTISRDKKLKFWDIKTLQCVTEVSTPHTHSIKSVAVSSDSIYIATGSYNGTIYIFNREKKSWHKNRVTNSGISCIEYDDYTKQFVIGSYNGKTYILPKGVFL